MLRAMLRVFLVVGLSLAVASGCAKSSEPVAPAPKPPPNVRNPTGDCATPPGNGARPGHGPSWRYLPDCKAPLRREYYRVFAWSESVASMFPRPDDAAATIEICTSEPPGSPLHALLSRYTLCDKQPNIERVNKMTAADALAIGHALHERLRFQANGGDVRPFPYDDDVLAVCDQMTELAQNELKDRCDYTRDLARRAAAGPVGEAYRMPPDGEGPPLAKALNELYGISN
jgi:hypothetical protein